MENWKIWLIICSVLSLICGLIATFMFLDMIFGRCFTLPLECSLNTSAMEAWWTIPLAFFVGFIVPGIAYILGKISDVFN